MKKVFATVMVLAALSFGSVAVMAQEAEAQAPAAQEEQVMEEAAPAVEVAEAGEAGRRSRRCCCSPQNPENEIY